MDRFQMLEKLDEFMFYSRDVLKDIDLVYFYNNIYPNYVLSNNRDELSDRGFGIYMLYIRFNAIFKLIEDIEYFNIDLAVVRKDINFKINKLNAFDMWLELNKINYELKKNYAKFIGFKNMISYYENKINSLNRDNIENCVKKYTLDMNVIKSDDIFVKDFFSKFISDFYKVGYEFIKLEFALSGCSGLFECFKSNNHDFWYMNKFISEEYCAYKDSVNYVVGLNSLSEIMEKKKYNDDDNYMEENILKLLSFISFSNEYKKTVCDEINRYEKELEDMLSLIKNIEEKDLVDDLFLGKIGFGKLVTSAISGQVELIKLKTEYNKVLNDLIRFVDLNNFSIDWYTFSRVNRFKCF